MCSRKAWSLKGFGQCDQGLDLSKRISEFDEYSCFKEEAMGDEEEPPPKKEKGCFRQLFSVKRIQEIPDKESPPMARSARAPGQNIFEYTNNMDDHG